MGMSFESTEKEKSRKEKFRHFFDRILIESDYGNGVLLHDQGNYILTKDEWEELKRKVDVFYAEISSELIEQHNDALQKPYREYAREQQRMLEKRTEKEQRRQEIDNRPTSIYIMVDHRTGYYKIGKSSKPAQREKTLQADNPLIELLFSFDSTHQQEKQLHAQYASKRIRGEWFALTEDDLSTIKGQCL